MKMRLTAPCHFGLEKTLSFEAKRAGGENVTASDGRICFDGDEHVLARANITFSVAERVGIVLGEFMAPDFEALFQEVKKIPIENYVGKNDKFIIAKGNSINSKLTSIPAIQRTIKKAMVLRMQSAYKTSFLAESGAEYPVRFLLMKNKMLLVLDSSGEGLHKRGYRAMSNEAPIKETLAAGIIDLARLRESDTLIDPLCGSGTILIESVFKALNIPPCINRRFKAMDWGFIPKKVWDEEFERGREGIRKDSSFIAYGYDIDKEAVALTESNAWKAGVPKNIIVKQQAVKNFAYPDKKVKIICNPPYAERLLEKEQAEEIYREMGQVMLPRGENEVYVITSNEDFEKIFGEKAVRNRKLYNGMLMCRLFSFSNK